MVRQFVFAGFDPSVETQDLAFKRFQNLYSLVPNDSMPKAIVEKLGNRFAGSIKIISNQGTFNAEASGKDPNGVIEKLFNEVLEKLAIWRKIRFL